ncbi:hypothetical protein BDW72DRAFT_185512 [Aspergillus terricola var. indicus]
MCIVPFDEDTVYKCPYHCYWHGCIVTFGRGTDHRIVVGEEREQPWRWVQVASLRIHEDGVGCDGLVSTVIIIVLFLLVRLSSVL